MTVRGPFVVAVGPLGVWRDPDSAGIRGVYVRRPVRGLGICQEYGRTERVHKPGRITVGVVDDEILVRAGIRGVLRRAEDIVVVGEAINGRAAVELAMRHRPHVLLVGIALPGRDELVVLREVRRHVPLTQVVMLATPAAGELLLPALRAGAAGFLLRNREPDELAGAVRAAAAGDAILCPTVTRAVVDHLICGRVERQEQARRQLRVLTTREREVLHHVAQGMGNARIARAMSLSEGSVKACVSRLLTKLRCENRVQVALIGYDAALSG